MLTELVLVGQLLAGPAPLCTAPDLGVKVQVSREEGQRAVAVAEVTNTSSTCEIRDLSLSLGPMRVSSNPPAPSSLSAGSSFVGIVDVPKDTVDVYLVASFVGQQGKQQKAAFAPSVTRAPSLIVTLTPGLLGLAGVIVGAWLAHLYTRGREREKTRTEDFRQRRQAEDEWSRMLYERYEQPLISFFNTWGDSLNPVVLRSAFDALIADCPVPTAIRNTYRTTMEALSTDSTPEKRRAAAGELRQAFDRFIYTPWQYTGIKEAQGHAPKQ